MVKENIEKLNPQIMERRQALKIRIYPNQEQKQKFNNFINTYRLVYNTAISTIKEEKKTNFIYIRNKVFEKINILYDNPNWFNELYFDSKKEKEIIVICDPQLPKGVKIDEDNNLYTEVSICANNVFKEDPNIQIMIGNKQFEIPVSSLYIKKEQIYRIRNQGISKVKDDYGIREKADIVVRIFLT